MKARGTAARAEFPDNAGTWTGFLMGTTAVALVALALMQPAVASPTDAVDSANTEADKFEGPKEPVNVEEEASANGEDADDAIAAKVKAAPRTEEGGWELYRAGLYPEAIMVWSEAADAGDAGAAYRVGATYLDGSSVERDIEKAMVWLVRSAEMGEPRAMGDLGGAYDWGLGEAVPADREKAAEWYEKGAMRGHAASQYNLGVLYEEGVGKEQDLVKAYQFYYLANKNGFPRYPAKAMEELEPKLTNAEIKEAIEAARSFEPI